MRRIKQTIIRRQYPPFDVVVARQSKLAGITAVGNADVQSHDVYTNSQDIVAPPQSHHV